ncbi:hypothetical protein FDECE_9938 [Fusarium decemcellulare]|nr:hypothetical protein FDECE_9938 [Fusarium decemcellulare]
MAAHPSRFNDPFWEAPQALASPQPEVSAPAKNGNGKALFASFSSLERSVSDTKFVVGGLGTISVKSALPREQLTFIVQSQDPKTQPTVTLKITRDNCILSKRDNDSEENKPIPEVLDFSWDKERSEYFDKVTFPKGKPSSFLNTLTTDKTTYWISVDRSNARIRYGQHLTNNSMTFMEIQFTADKAKWMKHLSSTDIYRDGETVAKEDIKFNDAPVTVDLPPLVVPETQISLEQLESLTAMTYVNLPEACQKLYHNISGPNITVQPPSFPQLAEAIDQSCKDPNKVCGKILKQKEGEFGDPSESYLRITVGDNLANSPGIPYVMEIWPPGHKSPIHQHGEASAVIRVLYGSIDVTWFDALQEGSAPKKIGNPVRISKGDVTWLGDKQYQIHQLQNNCKTVCITLQCYQFEKHDIVHDEAFHWIDKNRHLNEFIPNSDMAYGRFVQAMKAEWDAAT